MESDGKFFRFIPMNSNQNQTQWWHTQYVRWMGVVDRRVLATPFGEPQGAPPRFYEEVQAANAASFTPATNGARLVSGFGEPPAD